MPDQPRRRRGAPPGNINALKHGFYTRRLPASQLRGLEDHSFSGLSEEIAVLRLFIRQLVEHQPKVLTVDQAASYLRVISLALISLTRLIRTQHLVGDDDSIGNALTQALEEIRQEGGFKF